MVKGKVILGDGKLKEPRVRGNKKSNRDVGSGVEIPVGEVEKSKGVQDVAPAKNKEIKKNDSL